MGSASIRRRYVSAFASALLLALLVPAAGVARDGGGGHGGGFHGGGGGGGFRGGGGGGGGFREGGGRGGDGYRAGGGYHHDYGGGARTPALNHNISHDDYNRATNGGQDRFDANRLGWGNRNWNVEVQSGAAWQHIKKYI